MEEEIEVAGASLYTDEWASLYDRWFQFPEQSSAAVEFLASMSGGGPILELGMGTGRLALPLAQRGLTVHGIEGSDAMLRLLRQKPGAELISVTLGDFADVDVKERFSLVFVAFGTLFHLLSQEEQLRCFINVGAHLLPNGYFVVEAPWGHLNAQGRREPSLMQEGGDRLWIAPGSFDPASQRISFSYVAEDDQGVRSFPVELRSASPPELDLMARIAGMGLLVRFGSYFKEPFTAKSTSNISVYRARS